MKKIALIFIHPVNMTSFYSVLGFTVVSSLLYQTFQKLISPTVNPLFSLIVTYAIALVFSLILLPFFSLPTGILKQFQELNWATYALGLVIIGTEVGYLLVYRIGSNFSLTATTITALVTVLLIPIGFLLFKEKISILNMIGVVLCVGGIVLAQWK